MVTSEQQASLSDEQLAALERAVIGSPDLTQRAELSGEHIHASAVTSLFL